MEQNIKDMLSDIKPEEDLEKTATFTDIISRKEYRKRKKEEQEVREDEIITSSGHGTKILITIIVLLILVIIGLVAYFILLK